MREDISILTEHRYLSQAQPNGLIAALMDRNQRVVVVDPEERCSRVGDLAWMRSSRLVVARGRSVAVLCQLAAAEADGTPTINRAASVRGVLDKAEMAVRLSAAGIPIPRTYLSRIDRLKKEGPVFPLILKPITGDNAEGLRVVTHSDQLDGLDWPEPVALVQEFLPSTGMDLKLYGIGREVWAVRKPSPLADSRGGADQPADLARTIPVSLTRELRDLALACADLFGLELYGVDCMETPAGPVVIEVNDFPNYTSVPDASQRLADFLISQANEETQ